MGQSEHDGGRPLDFATYLMSLAGSALVQLGQAPDPESGDSVPPDLGAARQTIDVLGILEEKTRGNLNDAEARLLKNLVRDLRVRYVQATRSPST